MYCSRCGTRNDEDARYCEKCGADLGAMPKPTAPGMAAAAAVAPPPPVAPMPLPVYPPARPRAWWYPIGVWVILSAFFAFIDFAGTRTISWSVWPIGILGIFMVGFPLLHLIEDRASPPR